jgi:hypothetical protein
MAGDGRSSRKRNARKSSACSPPADRRPRSPDCSRRTARRSAGSTLRRVKPRQSELPSSRYVREFGRKSTDRASGPNRGAERRPTGPGTRTASRSSCRGVRMTRRARAQPYGCLPAAPISARSRRSTPGLPRQRSARARCSGGCGIYRRRGYAAARKEGPHPTATVSASARSTPIRSRSSSTNGPGAPGSTAPPSPGTASGAARSRAASRKGCISRA